MIIMETKMLTPFREHADRYEQWFNKHESVFESELLAIREQMAKLPENISGAEIGLGTGRFASRLGIVEGIEPVEAMRQKAIRRGIETMDAFAERLPYHDLHFDFLLFVTICYLEDAKTAFREAFRALKDGGTILVGFIDRDRPVGQEYIARKPESIFYRHARFYPAAQVEKMLKEAGFRDFEYVQTLFGKLDQIKEPQPPKEGYGDGGFVVVKATKKL